MIDKIDRNKDNWILHILNKLDEIIDTINELHPPPKCGICGEVYDENFNWDNYLGEINFYFASIKPPLHNKCYKKYCKERGYDG